MNVFKCDQCGCEAHISPPVEPLYECDADGNNPKPVMVDVPTYNHGTGRMENKRHHKTKDLKERIYIVRLSLGMQTVQADLCEECYKGHFEKLNEGFKYIGDIHKAKADLN